MTSKSIFARIASIVAIILSVAIAIVFISPKADAASINIVNPGFEAIRLQKGGVAEKRVPGWQLYDPSRLIDGKDISSYATFNPLPVFYPNGVSQGNNGAGIFIVKPPGSGVVALTQKLRAVLRRNTTYTLKVDIGNIAPSPDFRGIAGFPGYAVQLLAGGNIIAQDNDTVKPAEGAWLTSTVTYTTQANDRHLGKQLEIRLVNPLLREGEDTNFDHVRLDATTKR